jgi:hypothetical protein
LNKTPETAAINTGQSHSTLSKQHDRKKEIHKTVKTKTKQQVMPESKEKTNQAVVV